jgi:uncharacterized membrane protein
MHASSHPADEPFLVRQVPMTRPFIWLGRGWEDLKDHPMASLAYGALVSLMGGIILVFNHHPFMIAGSISAFLLFGPIMTVGLCELSRRRDSGEPRDFENSLRALRHNRAGLYGFANRLLLVSIIWILLSSMMLQAALGDIAPSLASTVWGDVLRQLSTAQLIAYLGAGGILATVIFAISVVSVPMILDLNADANSAIKTSLRVTLRDLPAVMVWAGLIVLLVGLGFATMLIGMVVVFPLLGHATWYAYRDLVH